MCKPACKIRDELRGSAKLLAVEALAVSLADVEAALGRIADDIIHTPSHVSHTLSRLVCAEDDDVDDMHRDIISEVKNAVRSDPELLDPLLRIMTVSHQLERVADHTTNIAEDVIYMVQGEIIRHGSTRKDA